MKNRKKLAIYGLVTTLLMAGTIPLSSVTGIGNTVLSNHAPYIPSNPNPANHAISVPITAVLSWTGGDPDGDPVKYDVYFGTSSSPVKVVSNQSATVYDPSGNMSYNMIYYWRIVAWDNHNASNSSAIWDFATEAAGGNHPPNVPTLLSPPNHATVVSVNADISWTAIDPDGDPVTYDVYFGTTNPPPKILPGNQTATTYDPGTMNYFTQYYWQIVAWDNHGASNTSTIWDFITEASGGNHPPSAPSSPNPANHAINISITADLSWTASIDPDGDPVTYDVYFGTSSSPAKVESNQVATLYNPPGNMSYSTKYYWRIVAWDNHGASNTSPVWDFTTKGKRGDANNDGKIDVGDVIYLINYLFKNGPAPNPLEAGDANSDGKVDVGDVIYLINYLFKAGPAPSSCRG